jgi:hypothetical protein
MQTPENTKIKSITIDGNPVDIHYGDCIYSTTIFGFSLIDRLRILFGKAVTLKKQYYTTQEVVIVYQDTEVKVAPIFKRRAKTPQYAYVDVPVGEEGAGNVNKTSGELKPKYNLTK